ncbi:MAG: alpha/beta hydrolase [Propionibacteriaceae bacterium]|jgi:pimeloyl-ACP methyl ester carboxylesterase|nr:alpha/beta hydrolase [Propionibacteriaceae bacterium]
MEKQIVRPGCDVVYDVLPGTEDVTVVLLHGYGLHGGMWTPQIASLQSQCYPVITIDVRGHGKSRPTADFSVALAANDVHAILDAEGVERPVLCGLSMGAFVVQEYAFQHGGATAYVLTGVTPLCIPYATWEKTLLAWSGPMMKYLYTWNSLKKAMAKGSTSTQEARAIVAQEFDEANKSEFLVSWSGFATCLHEEPGFTFDAPLLVMAGEQDTRGTIKSHLPDWERHYPGCEVRTIPGAGHVANLDQPATFDTLLGSFLKSLRD